MLGCPQAFFSTLASFHPAEAAFGAKPVGYVPTVTVSTLAGSTQGYADGPGSAALFHGPSSIGADVE